MAERTERSLLDLDSGLMDDVDVTFTDCRFEFDPGYNNGETLVLKTMLVVDDPDWEDREQFFPCGADWVTEDRGKTAVHPTSANKRFGKNSAIGTLISSMVTADGQKANNRLKEVAGGPFAAAFWEGLNCHINLVEHNFGKIGDATEDVKRDRMHITEVHGWKDAGGAKKATGAGKKAAATKAKPAPAPAPAEAETDGGLGALDADVRAKLEAIILSDDITTFDDFKERAILEVPECTTDPVAKAAIEDGEVGSLWDITLDAAQ